MTLNINLKTKIQNSLNEIEIVVKTIVDKYQKGSMAVELKEDRSLVTKADIEIEEEIRKILKRDFPDFGIYGEELGQENIDSDYVWFIDPIDGTLSFITGRPLFTTMIGLAFKGVPTYGWVLQPMVNRIWSSFCDISGDEIIENTYQNKVEELENAIIATTGPNYFNQEQRDVFNRVAQQTKTQVYGGDSYNYMMVAEGKIDVVMEANLKPYDFVPIIPIIKKSGGIITNWQGVTPDIFSPANLVVSTNHRLQLRVTKIISELFR